MAVLGKGTVMDTDTEVRCVSCNEPSREDICTHCEEMWNSGQLAQYVAGNVPCRGCDEYVKVAG